MMRFNPETKTFKLFNALRNGDAISASQAEKRFGIKNISAEVSRVRQAAISKDQYLPRLEPTLSGS